jgi:hypothetical protein
MSNLEAPTREALRVIDGAAPDDIPVLPCRLRLDARELAIVALALGAVAQGKPIADPKLRAGALALVQKIRYALG